MFRRRFVIWLVGAMTAAGVVVLSLPAASEASKANGAITAINPSSIQFELGNGSSLTAALPAAAVTYFASSRVIRLCETAVLAYHQTSAGAVLDAMTPTGVSTAATISLAGGGNCSTQSDGETDVVGTIVSISPSDVTVRLPVGGQAKFRLAPGRRLQNNQRVGDLVDVTYDAATRIAYDLEFSELYTSGTVLKVTTTWTTVKDAVTGATRKFVSGEASTAGINQRNKIGVVYYIHGGRTISDDIYDFSNRVNN
jgi:hypothetical protein